MNWILHHYDFSNFSEKVRLMLGFKGITWDSVQIPSHMPKPSYTPLTGGYRRTPSLQIGADIYCDTRLIADVIENHHPDPSYFGNSSRTRVLARSIADWVEARAFWPIALYITGINADQFPQDFHRDRATLHGKPTPDVQRVKAAAPKYLAQMRSELASIEDLFREGSSFVLGDTFTIADIAVYQMPWFLDTIEPGHGFVDDMPLTRQWMARVAAIGHGQFTSLDAEVAIERANQFAPQIISATQNPLPERFEAGDIVSVSPTTEVSPATGELVYADDERIVIRVANDRVKCVHVHFPRSGYRLSKFRSA
jgi:glutathione S-transferase